jgi:purple acid phosphatase-like protein/calcineurin-like phosphoesterase family protein
MIAAGTGLIAATAAGPARAAARGRQEAADGTPEQIHLTWGDDPTTTVVVSWASPGQAERPRVRIGQRVIAATERACGDASTGAVTWTYHARVDGLRPGATYGYAVTADNDANAADPFSATFTTAPAGRAAFRFTSFGDLTPPGHADNWQAAYAVGAVETFQPLFHLLNGDLTDAGLARGPLGPASRGQARRDFGNNVQASAANRPWLPVPGDHEIAPGDGEQGLASYLTRYTLPPNGVDGLEGRWYAVRVGTALFVCLSGDDVAYSSAGRGYSGGAQTRWLESTMAAARADASIDWIVVQLHQCACSSAATGTGSDLGIRQEWLPLFDTYEVDLVLSGHDHGYERSFPVRGFDAAAGTDTLTGATTDTSRPRPVTTVDSAVFDTSQGTVHLVLGSGGSGQGPGGSADEPGPLPRIATVFTRPAPPVPDQWVPGGDPRPAADAVEEATWSARRDASTGYGIAVFDVSPGSEAGGQTSITVRYYHAAGPDPADAGVPGPATGMQGVPTDDYRLFETFTLVRPRSDGRRWHPKGLRRGVRRVTVMCARCRAVRGRRASVRWQR